MFGDEGHTKKKNPTPQTPCKVMANELLLKMQMKNA